MPGLASLGGLAFRLDPSQVDFKFTIDASVTPTIGGKVVQVLGASLSHMTVQGFYGSDLVHGIPSWQLAEAFVQQCQTWADQAAQTQNPPPLHFLHPGYGWDFQTYIVSVTDGKGGGSVALDVAEFSYRYALELAVVQDNTHLTRAAVDQYITRLSEGIGWKQSVYNGPLSNEQVTAVLNGHSVADYLENKFANSIGLSPTGTG